MAGVGVPGNVHAGGGNIKPPRPGAGQPPPAAGGHGAPHGNNMARAASARAGRPHGAPHGGGSQQPYNWLQPLNPQQVTDQATAMVRAAYQPATQSLDQQSKQAQAILSKQQADNQYYQQWLDSKTAALQAQQSQVEQTTNQLEQQLTGNQLNQFSGQANTLIGEANARAGNVSNNSQSAEFNGLLSQNQAAMENTEGGAAQRMLAQENISQGQLGAATANTGAFLQAGAQKETANFNDAMTKIANARGLLQGKEGADIQKEIARLQGVQINLASSNRNYQTAATKLGLSAANIQSQINTRNANVNIAKTKLAEQLSQDQIKNMQSDRTFNLDKQKFDAQTAKDLYERQHGLGPYKPGKNGGQPMLSQSSQNAIFSKITKIQGELRDLIVNHGLSYQQAWHALNTGTYVQTPSATKGGNPGKTFIAPVGDTGLLNAAYNTLSGYGGGLTTGDVNYLHGLGVLIGHRLPIVPNYQSSQSLQGPH